MATRRSDRLDCEDACQDDDQDADDGACNDTAMRRSHFCLGGKYKNVGNDAVAPRSATCSQGRAVRFGYNIPRGVSRDRKEGIARSSR